MSLTDRLEGVSQPRCCLQHRGQRVPSVPNSLPGVSAASLHPSAPLTAPMNPLWLPHGCQPHRLITSLWKVCRDFLLVAGNVLTTQLLACSLASPGSSWLPCIKTFLRGATATLLVPVHYRGGKRKSPAQKSSASHGWRGVEASLQETKQGHTGRSPTCHTAAACRRGGNAEQDAHSETFKAWIDFFSGYTGHQGRAPSAPSLCPPRRGSTVRSHGSQHRTGHSPASGTEMLRGHPAQFPACIQQQKS